MNGCPYSEKVPDEWCQPGEIEPGLSEGSPLVSGMLKCFFNGLENESENSFIKYAEELGVPK